MRREPALVQGHTFSAPTTCTVGPLNIDDVINHMQSNRGSAYEIIDDGLVSFHKVIASWVPKRTQCCINKCSWTSANYIWFRYDNEHDTFSEPSAGKLHKSLSGTLSGEGQNNKQCSLQ